MAQRKASMLIGRTINTERRRSRGMPLADPLDIDSLGPLVPFCGQCNTADVSFRGCQFFITRPFKHGTRLRLEIPKTQATLTALVVRSIPAVPGMKEMLWRVCVELPTPGNYWGVEPPPPDWAF